ncbi:large ribosomal subunit protein uL18, partial [Lepeophtheirus salmonis]|uniref:large ribosomal subunit protein uL18 n=1 Tax=Lepeophtheirus salmonis TaxID=72036 RepID=UPI001AEB5281
MAEGKATGGKISGKLGGSTPGEDQPQTAPTKKKSRASKNQIFRSSVIRAAKKILGDVQVSKKAYDVLSSITYQVVEDVCRKCDDLADRKFRSRYQPKFKRANLLKTNYKDRRKLLTPNFKTYGNTKTRLVVRRTNTKIIAQLTNAFISGDKVIVQADSSELVDFGVKVGLTNYSASYLTGLLIGRKAELLKLKGPVFLDIGLNRSTKGARVYGVMKGAVDAGLNIPHGEKVLPGYVDGEDFNDSVLKGKIFGSDIISYMKILKEKDEEKYKIQFQKYIKEGVDETNLKKIYESAIEKISNLESLKKSEAKDYSPLKKFVAKKMTKQQKNENLKKRLEEANITK